MNVAVLGSGNGGCAVAFDFASHGHQVRMFDFDRFPDNIAAIHHQGGIHSEGMLSGFATVDYAGHDIGIAIDGAELILGVGPAYSTRPFAEACQPHLKPGQTVIVCPGSCAGSVEFMKGAGLTLGDPGVTVSETSTLPYAVRLTKPGCINVFLKVNGGLLLATLPGKENLRVLKMLQGVYPGLVPADNILQTTLQNGNPVIHPCVTLLNAALIERTGGDFYFYEQGVTASVGRLMRAVDQERIAIGRKLGVEIEPDPELGCQQGYMLTADYHQGYVTAPGFKGIKAQSSLENRYFHEDVGYGLVFMKNLADQIGVETPSINAVIQLASIVMDRDYLNQGMRTMKSLGLDRFDAAELKAYLS